MEQKLQWTSKSHASCKSLFIHCFHSKLLHLAYINTPTFPPQPSVKSFLLYFKSFSNFAFPLRFFNAQIENAQKNGWMETHLLLLFEERVGKVFHVSKADIVSVYCWWMCNVVLASSGWWRVCIYCACLYVIVNASRMDCRSSTEWANMALSSVF